MPLGLGAEGSPGGKEVRTSEMDGKFAYECGCYLGELQKALLCAV